MPLDALAFAALAFGAHRALRGSGRGALGQMVPTARTAARATVLREEQELLERGRRAIQGLDQPSARASQPRGELSLSARVARINKLIKAGSMHPEIRKIAGAVVAQRCAHKQGGWCVKEKDWKGEADAIFGFIRRNMRYTRDNAFADTFVAPHRTLFDRATKDSGAIGDCDDYTITMGALLASIGHDVTSRVGAISNPGDPTPDYNHIWLVDTLPQGGAVARRGAGGEYPLDASVAMPPGWQAPKNRIYKVRDFPVK